MIDFSHGLAIYERCPRAVEPLWVEVKKFKFFLYTTLNLCFEQPKVLGNTRNIIPPEENKKKCMEKEINLRIKSIINNEKNVFLMTNFLFLPP